MKPSQRLWMGCNCRRVGFGFVVNPCCTYIPSQVFLPACIEAYLSAKSIQTPHPPPPPSGFCLCLGAWVWAYLVILAMPVDHPVFAVGADLQLEGGDIVSLQSFLRNGALGGDAREHFQSVEVHLSARKRRNSWHTETWIPEYNPDSNVIQNLRLRTDKMLLKLVEGTEITSLMWVAELWTYWLKSYLLKMQRNWPQNKVNLRIKSSLRLTSMLDYQRRHVGTSLNNIFDFWLSF